MALGSGGRRVLSQLRLGPRARLALLLMALLALFLLVANRVPSPERVRAWIEPWGWAAPVAFVALAVPLHASFVPGPLLAGASGLLFGPLLGTAVTLTSSICSAMVELTVGRRTGREGMDRLGGPRYRAAATWLERHGFWAVMTLRLAPVLPDARSPTRPGCRTYARGSSSPAPRWAPPPAPSHRPRSAAR